MPLLSIVIPVYNEKETIEKILEKVKSIPIDKEIIIVDNCSTDGTQEILRKIKTYGVKVIFHIQNLGKGTSVRDGINVASGEFVILQDADLEYDPREYPNLMKPILEDKADIVLGARFKSGHSGLILHKLGNKFLTGLLNLIFGSHLNDYATCYKMARKDVFISLGLKSTSFNIEVEIVSKALINHLRIVEVPISYYPRKYSEGKKIRWLDGLWAIFYIFKYRFMPLEKMRLG